MQRNFLRTFFFLICFLSACDKTISPSTCVFCDKKIISTQSFYEDNFVVALLDHRPVVDGHSLIIPKRHVTRFEQLTNDELLALSNTIRRTHEALKKTHGVNDYILVQKNGMFNSVDHVHVHFIPERADSSKWRFILDSILSRFTKTLTAEEVKPKIDALKFHLQNTN